VLPSDELARIGLPSDRAFTAEEARAFGATRKRIHQLVGVGILRPLLRGVYAAADLELTVDVRAAALSLVVPPRSVVTDETAAWLHGVDLLDHRGGLPPLSFVRIHGDTRLRRSGVRSGTRMFVAKDLMRCGGVLLTTPLRTALDLGRRPGPARALGALDGLLRTGTLTTNDILRELPRFKGFRGVVQLRAITPMTDPRAESPAESRLRYAWVTSQALPRPDVQIEIPNPYSSRPWRVDLGVEVLKYGLEYDGERFHSSEEQRRRDNLKRSYLRDELGWTIDVLTKTDVYGPGTNPMAIARAGIRTARLNLGLPSYEWRWPDGTALPG